LLIGGLWIYHMSQFEDHFKVILDTYFSLENRSITWSYPMEVLRSEIFVENAHIASFYSSILVLFVGSQFNLALVLPKAVGIWESRKRYPILNLWLSSFFILWLTYYSNISIRYLSVVWIPLHLVTIIGISQLIQHFGLKQYQDQVYLMFISLNFLFFYPFIPFEFVLDDFHIRMFRYHQSIIRLAFYAIAISLLIIFYIKFFKRLQSSNKNGVSPITRVIAGGLIAIIIIAPVSFQTTVLISNGFDTNQFRREYVYDNRQSVMELAEYIKSHYQNDEEITIIVNIPGLEYFTFRPVIDLYFVNPYLTTDQQAALSATNTSYVIQELLNLHISYVVTLKQDHPFYEPYILRFVTTYPFLSSVEDGYGDLLFENDEFTLWKLHN
ncbi:MAG: hypothetical protein ACW98K_07980, partial [Candidatus Kariarchaeaceae archaeon]